MPSVSARLRLPSGLTVLVAAALLATPAPAAVWVASADLDPSHSFTAQITIDDGAGQIEFLLTGPDDRWFALGLGATSMNGTYSIITYPMPAVEERSLGNHSEGDVLLPAASLADHSTGGGTATFTIGRAQDPGTGAYVFDMMDVESGAAIPVIWGVGQDPSFSYHGNSNRGSQDIQFESDATPTPEAGMTLQSFGATKLVFRRVP